MPAIATPRRRPAEKPAVAVEDTSLTTLRMIRPDERLRIAIEGFLLDQRSEHTRRAYQKDLKRFVKYLLARRFHGGSEGEAIERVDRALLIAYKEFLLSEKLEHTSVDRHLATLRSFFGWLEQEGIIAKNPAEGVRFLNPRKLSTTQGLSDEEVRKVLEGPDLHTRTGALHYAILVTLLHAGLRRSELCALRTSQMGRERGHDVVRLMGKGNKERIIPLQPSVVSAIRYYARMERKDLGVDQPLFTPVRNNRTGDHEKPLDSSAIYYIVVKYARLAGIQQRISPHSCRATAISNARDRQAPDRAIQEFAGWTSTEMITRYDKRRTAVEKSAALLVDYGERDRTSEAVDAAGIAQMGSDRAISREGTEMSDSSAEVQPT